MSIKDNLRKALVSDCLNVMKAEESVDASKLLLRDPFNTDIVEDYKKRIKAGEKILPVFIDDQIDGRILDGNHRANACNELGVKVPVIKINRKTYLLSIERDKSMSSEEYYNKFVKKPSAKSNIRKALVSDCLNVLKTEEGQKKMIFGRPFHYAGSKWVPDKKAEEEKPNERSKNEDEDVETPEDRKERHAEEYKAERQKQYKKGLERFETAKKNNSTDRSIEEIAKNLEDPNLRSSTGSLEPYEENLEDWVNYLDNSIEENLIMIRVDFQNVESILASGELKNQWETGTSGGSISETARNHWERRIIDDGSYKGGMKSFDFQLKEDEYFNSHPASKPLYGYVGTDSGNEGTHQYGDIQFVLKDDLKDRSTFTPSDSSLESGAFVRGQAKKLFDVKDEFRRNWLDVSVHNVEQTKSGKGYIEAQIHGGIQLKDHIAKIVVPRHDTGWEKEKLQLEKFAKENGIEFEWAQI